MKRPHPIGSTTGAIDDPTWQTMEINMNNPAWGDAMNPSDIATVGSGAAATSSFTVFQAPEPSALVSLAAGVAVLALCALATRRRRSSGAGCEPEESRLNSLV